MAVTTPDSNNKLIRFTQEINREFVRENLFSPYMGEGMTSIIRLRSELKAGSEDMNIPLVTRLQGAGVATETLVGAEEKIDNYGMRVRIEWARNAVVTTKAEAHKDSADIFGEAKPLLSDWGKELQRDELIEALMALPSETLPTSSGGVRVNGIKYEAASAAQHNTWLTNNSDRIVYGAATANAVSGVHATALGLVDTTNDKFTATNLALLKRKALTADPRIRPYKTRDGYEYLVAFAGASAFRDLKASLDTTHQNAMPRSKDNIIFQVGDLEYDGVIVRMVPEISTYVTNVWTSLLTAGDTTGRIEPVFLCGQQAAVFAWGQMAKPTFRKEDDYGFINGVGIEMAYGVSKMFKKHPMTGTALKQWGMATGFYSAPAD